MSGTLGALLCPAQLNANRTDKAAAKPAATMTTYCFLQDENKVTVLPFGQSKPVATPMSNDAVVGGICRHCDLRLEFRAADAPKKCPMCTCGATNASCLIVKSTEHSLWQEMLAVLPRGTALNITYAVPEKPESGIKRLDVDRRTVLLPVEGLEQTAAAELLAMTKPLGSVRAESAVEGRQIKLTLKEDWDLNKESRLEKALEKRGARIAYPKAPAAQDGKAGQ